ncbi:hypothetical protein CVT25_011528 [Psilocybe cyanescens]|uniref:Uncharacterized protein n=1 Tax=Psilocybe cyanescens TaxID=93625 RepID=A0A409XV60_PSICY|nr:hypothetical protein CVT25_011528 [Psilocybe cyanescens]
MSDAAIVQLTFSSNAPEPNFLHILEHIEPIRAAATIRAWNGVSIVQDSGDYDDDQRTEVVGLSCVNWRLCLIKRRQQQLEI